MRIADTVQDSIVDGPGFRFTVFTQGCPHDCPGCHNPGTHDMDGGREVEVQELIGKLLGNPMTDGLTLSGGEPFVQPHECAELARAARENGLNVWTYTGFKFEELMELSEADPSIRELLEATDVLIDGPFILAERSLGVKWRGSKNQRLIDVKKSLERGEAAELEAK